MIRLLIAGLMVLMAGNAKAIINEDLYLYCKSYSDNDFKPNKSDHINCITYFVGVAELAETLCTIEKYGGLNYNTEYLDASIQNYLNRMKNNPDQWKYTAALQVWVSLAEINGADCPPK